ncbi:transglycosylase SLT domain-containing protein, partial [Kocuria sp. ZOR0020]|uniref:transglycosylase SLT domain-containing protein n=1 Tax=Kocuria sp. ZOR0020 TaxID=1339234 RepID=UPI0009DF1147
HIRQAKEKALEEQRREAINHARERDREKSIIQNDTDSQDTDNSKAGLQIEEPAQQTTSSVIGSDWSQVSPEIAANYMSSKTGVSASKWLDVIYKESSGNPYVENELSCWGLLQIMQSVHGQVSNLSPQDYLDKAVSIYQGSGGTAWETW